VELQRALPQYEITERIGLGGMGAVYKGTQRSLDRLVAIKILPRGLEDDDVHYAERFKLEAKAMARLSHPGIVAVFDAGETADGLLYFVMEFIEGTDVQKMIAQGPLEGSAACDLLEVGVFDLERHRAAGQRLRQATPPNLVRQRGGLAPRRTEVEDVLGEVVAERGLHTCHNSAYERLCEF